MKTLIYKRRGSYYECMQISDGGGDEVRVVFDEPLTGKVRIANRLFELSRGTCSFSLTALPEGEHTPHLITSAITKPLEAIVIRDGCIMRGALREEYLREVNKRCDQLEERLTEAEELISELLRKIENTISF